MPIVLKDNQYRGIPWGDAAKDIKYEGWMKDALLRLDGVSLKSLASKEHDFLVFPSGVVEKDLADKNFVYSLLDKTGSAPKFQTGNVMGFLGLGKGVQMQIGSRFDEENKNYFLHYMLQKICNVAYTPETESGKYPYYDFLLYLFPSYLNAALRQGVYHTYVVHECNDSNLRGPLDINRHIKNNIPFNGKIAYCMREYTTDNNVMQLVRHTIEYIRSFSCGCSILCGDVVKETRDNIRTVEQVTLSYCRTSRMQVVSKNFHRIAHPYYTAYEPLRKLCLAIMLREKTSYGNNSSEPISGILFDGACLWEEYLVRVLEKSELGKSLKHPNNRTRCGVHYLFKKNGANANQIFPDLIFTDTQSGTVFSANAVLDAKYKRLEGKIDREDAFQMLAYLFRFKAKLGFLLHPSRNDAATQIYTLIQKEDESEIRLIQIPLMIPQGCDTFDEFAKEMEKAEINFRKHICACIN